jgi:hypothetical protein
MLDLQNDKTIDLKPDTITQPTNDILFTEDTNSAVSTQQSPNFIKGVSGWRLNSNGIIEAVGVQLAGSIVAENVVDVIYGGTGVQSIVGIPIGTGTSPLTAIVPLAGSGTFYVAATSGGSPTVKIDYNSGIITART